MLVLTRKTGENIRIGSDVTVTVLSVRSGHVKLGIEAPQGLSVHRGEVYERIAQANREAAQVASGGARSAVLEISSKLRSQPISRKCAK